MSAQLDRKLSARLVEALVGRPLVDNAFRGTLVEAMLAQVLEPEWRWCSAGWAAYDFEDANGVGLEVKQSAALQEWHEPGVPLCRGRFDIAARTGRREGARWIAAPGRAAAIYVFAWHGVTDRGLADHRDPGQWQFYPVRSSDLPPQKSIALSMLGRIARPLAIGQIAEAIGLLGRGAS